MVSCYGQIVPVQPLGHVVVFPAPAPVLVGEAVDNLEVLDTHGRDSAKESLVRQLVVELVNSHRHVARLGRAGVEITIVLNKEVNIVEH